MTEMTDRQLTFSTVLSSERTPELRIQPNRSVEPRDKPRLSRQAKKILKRLEVGPATTSELAAIGLQYNARVSEIRHVIVKDGLMVDEIPGEGGENGYCIVSLCESKFWQKIKQKGQCWKWLK